MSNNDQSIDTNLTNSQIYDAQETLYLNNINTTMQHTHWNNPNKRQTLSKQTHSHTAQLKTLKTTLTKLRSQEIHAFETALEKELYPDDLDLSLIEPNKRTQDLWETIDLVSDQIDELTGALEELTTLLSGDADE
jgi:chromosome segregation ATPase